MPKLGGGGPPAPKPKETSAASKTNSGPGASGPSGSGPSSSTAPVGNAPSASSSETRPVPAPQMTLKASDATAGIEAVENDSGNASVSGVDASSSVDTGNASTAAEANSNLPYGVQDSLALSRIVSDIRRRRVSAVLNDPHLYLSYLLPLRALFARMAESIKRASEGHLGTFMDDLVGQGADATRFFADLAEVDRIFSGIASGKQQAGSRRSEEENELVVDLRVVVEGLREMAEVRMELDEEEEESEGEKEGVAATDGGGPDQRGHDPGPQPDVIDLS